MRWLLTWLVIALVWAYRLIVRPFLPPSCRFMPSCSEYMIQAVLKYGPIRGAWKGLCRLGRCHPWHPGGYDPP
jgi:putative membrane protein insertion efficiency factor